MNLKLSLATFGLILGFQQTFANTNGTPSDMPAGKRVAPRGGIDWSQVTNRISSIHGGLVQELNKDGGVQTGEITIRGVLVRQSDIASDRTRDQKRKEASKVLGASAGNTFLPFEVTFNTGDGEASVDMIVSVFKFGLGNAYSQYIGQDGAGHDVGKIFEEIVVLEYHMDTIKAGDRRTGHTINLVRYHARIPFNKPGNNKNENWFGLSSRGSFGFTDFRFHSDEMVDGLTSFDVHDMSTMTKLGVGLEGAVTLFGMDFTAESNYMFEWMRGNMNRDNGAVNRQSLELEFQVSKSMGSWRWGLFGTASLMNQYDVLGSGYYEGDVLVPAINESLEFGNTFKTGAKITF